MLDRNSLITTASTRQHAEWAAQAFRRHEAFRDGEITVVPPSPDDDKYLLLYTGPARHAATSFGVEPLDLAADDFEDRAAADRACGLAGADIPSGDISDVHVESIGASGGFPNSDMSDATVPGPWRLVWLHASIRLRGQPEPDSPRRPGAKT